MQTAVTQIMSGGGAAMETKTFLRVFVGIQINRLFLFLIKLKLFRRSGSITPPAHRESLEQLKEERKKEEKKKNNKSKEKKKEDGQEVEKTIGTPVFGLSARLMIFGVTQLSNQSLPETERPKSN